MKRTLLAISLVFLFASGMAMATAPWTAADITLTGTYGSGANASYLVVDFGPNASYAFKYLWDTPAEGSVFGSDMINAVADETNGVPGLVFTSHESKGLGMMVDAISYAGHSGANDYPNPWWNYWTGTAGNEQASSWSGCSGSEISNGSIDSWVLTKYWYQPPAIPGVPEPSSLLALCSLIGLAGSAKLLRGRSGK